MKTYWPLAVITLVLSAILGLSQYVDHDKRDYEKRHPQARAVAKDDNRQLGTDLNQPYQPPGWAKYVTFPEGVGAWAVILTLLAIIWQSIETHASAKAAGESANAAYGSLSFAEAQLEMMREKERARLDLDVKRVDLEAEVAEGDLAHLLVTLSIRNIGASRAFIRRTFGILITKLGNEELSRDYAEHHPLNLPEQFIDCDKPAVPVEVYLFPATTTAQTFAECLEKGIFSLHFYGFIKYETLGLRWVKNFGYDWKIIDRDSVLGGLYGLSDPYPNSPMPPKDRIAYGYWELNDERDQPEHRAYPDQNEEPQAN